MPELPDVEIYRQVAEQHALHRKVAHAGVPDPGSLEGIKPAELQQRLQGRPLHACRRVGKILLLEWAHGPTLAMHFGTNGALRHRAADEAEPKSVRLWFEFADGGRLDYINPRRIGHVHAAEDSGAFVAQEELGPDVLDPAFTEAAFKQALAGTRQSIKALLMDQKRMAGIGNIYSDEILFHAHLHPAVTADSLDAPAQHRLFQAMRSVLQTAIDCGAGAEDFTDRLPKGFLLPQRHAGGHCPRCGTAIRSMKSGGRTAYYCPKCQPEP